MTPRNVGAYAKLLANYASDDAVIAAGEAAELLFVRGLAFCSTSDSDGYITDGQLVRVVGAGMRDAAKRAQRLVEVGLWSREDGGYEVRSWLKMHESAAEKGRKRSTDRERKRRERDPESGTCPSGQQSDSERTPTGAASDSERIPDGVTLDSLDCTYVSKLEIQSSPIQSSPASPAADSTAGKPPKRQIPRRLESAFAEFWAAFPRRIGKRDAERKFEIAARNVDPQEIVNGAKRYAETVRNTDPRFITHPATWLHQGRWDDEPARTTAARSESPWDQ